MLRIKIYFPHFSDEYNELRLGDFKRLNELPSIRNDGQLPKDLFGHFWRALSKAGVERVKLNHGLCKDLSFYNGIYFDVVSPSIGKVIGSGGRYDSVLAAFGSTANATGFAIRLHYLERALSS